VRPDGPPRPLVTTAHYEGTSERQIQASTDFDRLQDPKDQVLTRTTAPPARARTAVLLAAEEHLSAFEREMHGVAYSVVNPTA
jgi:hypothetical protein